VEGDSVKTSVVFLAELLCDAQLWQPQIVGLGPSIEPWVADLMRDDSIAGMARRALAEAPFAKFALAGLSMGGYVAMEILRQQKAIMERPDSRDALWKIRCPTLVLCGEHDLLTPRDRHEEISAAIRGSTLVVLPGCGHLSTLEKPLEVNRALSAWLTVGGQTG
jgi:pimeloyl-ACP methyl ester carboxylesterase